MPILGSLTFLSIASASVSEYRFGIGERGGPIQGEDPDSWMASLKAKGFGSVALFVEPFDGSWETIMRLGFVGGERWAPVTSNEEVEVVWHDRSRFDPVAKEWSAYRGGFRVMPGQERVRASPETAAASLDAALTQMIDSAKECRREEWFSEMFLKGRRQLQSAGLVPTAAEDVGEAVFPERIRFLFPKEFESMSFALIAAVESSWALGGMGWWNDWSSPDPELQARFQQATLAYYEAMITCLAAACEPPR